MSISQEKIQELKKQYGKIFAIDDYIVRRITLGEFKEIEDLDPIDAEDRIVELALLYPKSPNDIPAGHFSSLANDIIEISDFMDPAQVLEDARARSKQIRRMMYAFVIATQDRYSEDDLDKLTLEELADKVALGENIIEIQRAMYDPSIEVRLVVGPESEEEQIPNPPEPTAEEWAHASRGAYANPDTATTFGTASASDPIAQQLRAAMG